MSMEYEWEPVRGLPGRLPPGEHILWQGAPDWKTLALRVFRVRLVAAYFAAIMIWRAADMWLAGASPLAAIGSGLWIAPLAIAALAILTALAYGMARASIYTLTNRRVVLRVGLALPKAFNVPFAKVTAASFKPNGDGTGDIALSVGGEQRFGYAHLWPHVRPWRFGAPQPAMRALPGAEAVAQKLADALAAYQRSEANEAAELREIKAPDGRLTTIKPQTVKPQAAGVAA